MDKDFFRDRQRDFSIAGLQQLSVVLLTYRKGSAPDGALKVIAHNEERSMHPCYVQHFNPYQSQLYE